MHLFRTETRWNLIHLNNDKARNHCDLKPEYEDMKCPFLGKSSDFCSNEEEIGKYDFGEFECTEPREYEFGSFIEMPNGFGLAKIDNVSDWSTDGIEIPKTVCFNRCKSNKGTVRNHEFETISEILHSELFEYVLPFSLLKECAIAQYDNGQCLFIDETPR